MVERLARKHLLPKLGDGFVARRSLVYRRPLDHFLYALKFGTSAFTSTRLYVEAFVQALFVPADGLTWAEAEYKKLMSLQSLDVPVVSQAVGYGEILRGQKKRAVELLELALESERKDDEYANEERIEQIERVLEAVGGLGLEAGQALLEE